MLTFFLNNERMKGQSYKRNYLRLKGLTDLQKDLVKKWFGEQGVDATKGIIQDIERGAIDKVMEPLVVKGMGKLEECIA